MNRIKLLAVGLLAAVGIGVGATACSTPAYPAPASYYVTYQGACYVGYLYDPSEALMFNGVPATCTRMVYPSYAPPAGTVAWTLWTQLLTYDSYYHSSIYYDDILYPMSTRYHVTIISRTSFGSLSHDFDTRNAKTIKADSAKAKWSNGKSGAYKFPTTNSTKAKNKPLTNKNTNYGTDSSRSKSSTTTKTKSGSGLTGKSGSSRSGSGFGGSSRSGGRR